MNFKFLSDLQNILKKIDPNNSSNLRSIIFFLFVGLFFEVLGLGILYPIFKFIFESETTFFSQFSESFSPKFLKIFFLILIIIIYFIRSAYLTFMIYKQNRYVSYIYGKIGLQIFKNYLTQPYKFHLNNSSSLLYKNLNTELGNFNIFIGAVLSFLVEVIFCIVILFTIFFIDPLSVIVLIIYVFICSYFFISITKSRLNLYGKVREEVDNDLSKLVLESLSAIKDIFITDTSARLISKYKTLSIARSKIYTFHNTLSLLPRFFLEFVAVSGLVLFLILMISLGKPMIEIYSTIGILLVAILRIIPSINKIIASLQQVRFYAKSTEIITNELNLISKDQIFINSFNSTLEFKNVSFSYGKKEVFQKINLQIKKGDLVAIKGSSGAGKSTLINILSGIITDYEGNYLVDGLNVKGQILKASYAPQEVFLFNDSIEYNITLCSDKLEINNEHLYKCLKISQLDGFISLLPEGVNTFVGERGAQISGGQKQRIGIARALYNSSEVIILDEPTSSLDKNTEELFIQDLIKNFNTKTIILISHNEKIFRHLDRVFKIENKKIFRV